MPMRAAYVDVADPDDPQRPWREIPTDALRLDYLNRPTSYRRNGRPLLLHSDQPPENSPTLHLALLFERKFWKLIQPLRLEDQQLLIAHFRENLSPSQIAERGGTSPQQVTRRMELAYDQIFKALFLREAPVRLRASLQRKQLVKEASRQDIRQILEETSKRMQRRKPPKQQRQLDKRRQTR